jgi:hypothetical protein
MAPLTEYLLDTVYCGTYFTTEDRVEQYGLLYEMWKAQGSPDGEFTATIDDQPVKLNILWDPYYAGYPMILLRHGFRILPWIKPIVSPRTTKGIAITGTGSGKTANVAAAALVYCFLNPGFGFLNAGPRQRQSDLMLGEVEKWVSNAPFLKFVELSKGANQLWKEINGYPTVTIRSPINPDVKSTFICQTIGTDADNILGMGRDWINVDETQLIQNMGAAEPKIVTRMRGTRADGKPTWSKLTCISNPGDNLDFGILVEKYERLAEEHPDRVVVLKDVDASENIYITARQLREMQMAMGEADMERWLGGSMSAIVSDATISEDTLELCRDRAFEERVERVATQRAGLGIMEYELPYDTRRDYMVVGDIGKSALMNLGSLNVPAIMVFDITNFLEEPHALVAFSWLDGKNTYKTWTKKMEYLMMKYRCKAYYDAGNVQSAFEDVGPFQDLPMTVPLYFSGRSGIKDWSLAIITLMMQRGAFRLPYIKALWHQARIYDPRSKKKPDDVMTCFLLFARAIAAEGALWNRFTENFKHEYFDESDEADGTERHPERPYEDEVYVTPVSSSRYARIRA